MMFNWFNKSGSPTLTSACSMTVTEAGLLVSCQDENQVLQHPKTLPEALWLSREALLDQDMASVEPVESVDGLLIPFESLRFLKSGFAALAADESAPDIVDANLSDFLPPISEMTVKLEPNGNRLLAVDLQLEASFWHEGNREHPRRVGPWLTFAGQASLMNETQWRLCQIADQFNQLENKTGEDNYSALAEVYQQLGLNLSDDSTPNVELNGVLEDTVVLAPSRIGMGWQQDSKSDNATHSAYPVLLDVPVADSEQARLFEDAFKKEFFQDGTTLSSYSLPPLLLAGSTTPKRVQVLLPPAVQDAAVQMRRALRGLPKEKAQKAALNPLKQFEGLTPDALDFNLASYGPRVTGLGPLVFRPVIKTPSKDRLLDENWDLFTLEATGADGDLVSMPIAPEDLQPLQQKLQEALVNGDESLEIVGKEGESFLVAPTPGLLEQIKAAQEEEAAAQESKPSELEDAECNEADNNARHLRRIENEMTNAYIEITEQKTTTLLRPFEKPEALVDTIPDGTALRLDTYQQDGTAWLQTSFLNRKPGVLLADDMGLGKTLQVLTFLAWLIESGWQNLDSDEKSDDRRIWDADMVSRTRPVGQNFARNPHPILVVVPKMLLANWKLEIEKFFRNRGEIFNSYEILDSQMIKSYMLPKSQGNDFRTGYPSLNPDYLLSNRLIIANYDTVKNYYHSFAKIRWACMVLDESQAIKNPSSALTQVISMISSNARFKITMTGTPIENDLMDLWTLFDVAAPGLLPPERAFKTRFYDEDAAEHSHGWDMSALRQALKCDGPLNRAQAASYVLGRNKKEFLGAELPALVDMRALETGEESTATDLDSAPSIHCHFPYKQAEWEQQEALYKAIAKEKSKTKHLKAVQAIKSFAEHPWLTSHNPESLKHTMTTENLLAHSSKFRWLLQALQGISQRKEKALIFTRSLTMQRWICQLLKERFSIDYRPINGASSTSKSHGTMSILEQFQEQKGFSALVLSPEVAGVGLNITAANHVIHYGRWWNPAKEDQATCRAYRKGQKRPVYLYIPIGSGPNGEEGFDQRLDRKMRYKSAMRHDFLSPVGDLEAEEF
jgi:SNF2 family DNA or RNA helicase